MEKEKLTPEEQLAKTAQRLMEEGVCAAAIHYFGNEANRFRPKEPPELGWQEDTEEPPDLAA